MPKDIPSPCRHRKDETADSDKMHASCALKGCPTKCLAFQELPQNQPRLTCSLHVPGLGARPLCPFHGANTSRVHRVGKRPRGQSPTPVPKRKAIPDPDSLRDVFQPSIQDHPRSSKPSGTRQRPKQPARRDDDGHTIVPPVAVARQPAGPDDVPNPDPPGVPGVLRPPCSGRM